MQIQGSVETPACTQAAQHLKCKDCDVDVTQQNNFLVTCYVTQQQDLQAVYGVFLSWTWQGPKAWLVLSQVPHSLSGMAGLTAAAASSASSSH